MNLSYVYENRHKLPDESVQKFRECRKHNLNTVELIGLETILCMFAEQYEKTEFGEVTCTLSDCTRWNESSVDILDGYYDTFVFENYAISEIWMTDNGCILLDCYELAHSEHENAYEIIRCTDWQSECKPVTFRLD